MCIVTRVGDLEIDQDLAYQERDWKAERVGWVVLLAVVLVAALGLFGHGPVSWTSRSSDDGSLEVSFERFGRRGGTQELVVRADASSAAGGVWQLEISTDYIHGVTVDTLSPEPDSVESAPGSVRYTFVQADPRAPLEAVFSMTPDALWGHDGEISLVGGGTVRVSNFFFP